MPRADKLRELLARGDWHRVALLFGGLDSQVAADALLSISPERQQSLFRSLPVDAAARIASALPYYDAYVLLHSLPLEQMRAIIDGMEIGERLRFFDELPEEIWQRLMGELGETQPGGAHAAEISSHYGRLAANPSSHRGPADREELQQSRRRPGAGDRAHQPFGRARIDHRAAWAFGLRQIHAAAHAVRTGPAVEGEVLWHGEPLRELQPERRDRVPELRLVSLADGAGERRGAAAGSRHGAARTASPRPPDAWIRSG